MEASTRIPCENLWWLACFRISHAENQLQLCNYPLLVWVQQLLQRLGLPKGTKVIQLLDVIQCFVAVNCSIETIPERLILCVISPEFLYNQFGKFYRLCQPLCFLDKEALEDDRYIIVVFTFAAVSFYPSSMFTVLCWIVIFKSLVLSISFSISPSSNWSKILAFSSVKTPSFLLRVLGKKPLASPSLICRPCSLPVVGQSSQVSCLQRFCSPLFYGVNATNLPFHKLKLSNPAWRIMQNIVFT